MVSLIRLRGLSFVTSESAPKHVAENSPDLNSDLLPSSSLLSSRCHRPLPPSPPRPRNRQCWSQLFVGAGLAWIYLPSQLASSHVWLFFPSLVVPLVWIRGHLRQSRRNMVWRLHFSAFVELTSHHRNQGFDKRYFSAGLGEFLQSIEAYRK